MGRGHPRQPQLVINHQPTSRLAIARLAMAQGITISDLHYRTRIGLQTITRLWRNDPNRDPLLSTLERIAAVLGVSARDLIEEEPDQQEASA